MSAEGSIPHTDCLRQNRYQTDGVISTCCCLGTLGINSLAPGVCGALINKHLTIANIGIELVYIFL